MDNEVRLVKELKGKELSVAVGFWEKSDRVIHPKEIYQRQGPNRVVLHDPVTSVSAARRVMKEIVAKLRKEGWKDELTPDEQARVDAADNARGAAYNDREAAKRAAAQAKLNAFPKTKLDKKLAAAIAKPAKVTKLDLRGSKGNTLSMVPPSIVALKNLRVLLLDDNGLDELPEDSFWKLKALEYVSAARNKLTSMSWAAYAWKLRLLNVHSNRIEVANVGRRQKNFEIQMGDNPLTRLGWFPKTHTIGVDTKALFPLNDDRYEKPWKSVRLVHLYGRDLTANERTKIAKYFPKAELKYIGAARKGPLIQTKL